MSQQPDFTTGDATFDAYTAGMAGSEALLGHLVLYSVYDGEVTHDDLTNWFAELSLDPRFLPPPLRAVDAYERVTGPDGVRISYPLDNPEAALSNGILQRGHTKAGDAGTVAGLMLRPVRRDGGKIVRHIVREVRDEKAAQLSYDTRLGTATFHRDNDQGSVDGAGTLEVAPDNTVIAQLPEAEQAVVRAMLDDIQSAFDRRCLYMTADRLRSVIRKYIEFLRAIRVRPTGGVYFVHRKHADTLAALRELVGRFGGQSHLARIPLPDQEEMRELVISAFTTKTKDDLNRLALDIAEAQRTGKAGETDKLYHRFAELQQATAEHAELLSTSLDDADAALQLVKVQLGALLVSDNAVS